MIKSEISRLIPDYLGFLFIGSLSSAKNIEELARLGITYVLTVARISGVEFEYAENIRHLKIQIEDHPASNILSVSEECFGFIDAAVNNNSKILVHCASGISRSVTICTMYIMKRYALSAKVALAIIRECRPLANPNIGFMHQIKLLESCSLNVRYAEAEFQKAMNQTDGRGIVALIAEKRNTANDFHKEIDELELLIKAATNPPLELRQLWLNGIQRILSRYLRNTQTDVDRIACSSDVGNTDMEDRVATMITKSATEKCRRLVAELEVDMHNP